MDPRTPIDILLVDDNPGKLLALEAALAPLGQNLVTATSGRGALHQLLERDFAVIILDVNMPDIDGFETARMIRARQRSSHTPIVFVSAVNLDPDDALEGYALGAVDYIFAPIIPEVLRAKVAVFAELHRKTEEVRHQAERLRQRTEELERSQRELQLAERMATIGTLCAGLGHDMGNLLLPICVWVDTLEEETLPESASEAIESLRTCVDYLRRLSGGLRQLALDPETEYGERDSLLHAWRDEVEPILRNAIPRGVSLEFSLGTNLPRVRIARHQLTQAVFNLVQNAGEAMRKRGAGTIRISAEHGPGSRTMRLLISDDGPGMTPAVAARCFDPFFTTKTRGISTGLGLALVNGIVQRCGGTIAVRSTSKGTTFELALPIVDPQEAGRRLAVISLAEPRIQGYATGVLKLAGFEVHRSLPPGHDGAALWITDPGEGLSEVASRFVAGRDDRKVLVYSDRECDVDGAAVFSMTPGGRSLREYVRTYLSGFDSQDSPSPTHPSPPAAAAAREGIAQ